MKLEQSQSDTDDTKNEECCSSLALAPGCYCHRPKRSCSDPHRYELADSYTFFMRKICYHTRQCILYNNCFSLCYSEKSLLQVGPAYALFMHIPCLAFHVIMSRRMDACLVFSDKTRSIEVPESVSGSNEPTLSQDRDVLR